MTKREIFDNGNFVSEDIQFLSLETEKCFVCSSTKISGASGHVHINDGYLTHIIVRYCSKHKNVKNNPISLKKIDCDGIGCYGWWNKKMGIIVVEIK